MDSFNVFFHTLKIKKNTNDVQFRRTNREGENGQKLKFGEGCNFAQFLGDEKTYFKESVAKKIVAIC